MKPRVWILLLAATALVSCGRQPDNTLLPQGLLAGEVVKVELESDFGPYKDRKKVILEKPDEIRALLAAGTLVKKEPCPCLHGEKVTFHTKEAKLVASICEHCFDIWKDGEVHNYSMPPEFYPLFQKHLDSPEAMVTPPRAKR